MNVPIVFIFDFKDKDETRKVKIIRLNTRATNREKDFSMSVDLKVYVLISKQSYIKSFRTV